MSQFCDKFVKVAKYFCLHCKIYLYRLWNNVLNLTIVGIRPSTICIETRDSMRSKLMQTKYKSLPTGWMKSKINLLCNLVQLFSYHFLLSCICEVHLLVIQPPIGIWSCCIHPTSTPTSGALDPTILDKYFKNWNNFVFVFVIFFFGQVMSPHHSYQMSQRSQVSRIVHWRCSLDVFVFVVVILFVFVFVFVIVLFLVSSCLLISRIKCLKGHKYLGLLFEGAL